MKSYVTTILLSTLCFNSICAQDKLENDFNRWSVEVNIFFDVNKDDPNGRFY